MVNPGSEVKLRENTTAPQQVPTELHSLLFSMAVDEIPQLWNI
jgi:lipopolysaccharide/colanic/teichoic acid biosynthesis glycosyltransferase